MKKRTFQLMLLLACWLAGGTAMAQLVDQSTFDRHMAQAWGIRGGKAPSRAASSTIALDENPFTIDAFTVAPGGTVTMAVHFNTAVMASYRTERCPRLAQMTVTFPAGLTPTTVVAGADMTSSNGDALTVMGNFIDSSRELRLLGYSMYNAATMAKFPTGDLEFALITVQAAASMSTGAVALAMNNVVFCMADDPSDFIYSGTTTATGTVGTTQYAVNYTAQPTGGTVAVSRTTAPQGTTVTITTTPDTGYEVDAVSVVTTPGGANVTVTAASNGRYTFSMPASDVNVNVTFQKVKYPLVINGGEEGSGTSEDEGGTTSVDDPNPTMGETVTITPHPYTGWEVGSVVVRDRNGNTITVTHNANGTYSFVMPAGGVYIYITYVKIVYTIIINGGGSSSGGTTSIDRPNATIGDVVTITPHPNTGYSVGTVVIIDANGNTVNVTYNNNGTYTFIMPAGNVTITVTYVLTNFTISLNDGENGHTTLSRTTATMGQTVTFTPVPDTGYELESATATDANGNNLTLSLNGSTYSFVMPASNVTVTTTFKKKRYPIVINGGEEGSGSSEDEGGTTTVDNPNPTMGETVTITPNPNTGWGVGTVVVIDANGNVINVTVNDNGTYTFVMPAGNVTINVTYVLIHYTIIINGSGTGGTTTVDKPNATMGETVTITPNPSTGYGVGTVVIIDASGNTVNVTYNDNGTYTFIMPAGDVTINVTYVLINYTIIINGGGSGTGGTTTVDKPNATMGETVTVTTNPNTGYTVGTIVIIDASGNTVNVTYNNNGTYTFIMPAGNVTINVTYVLINYTIIINGGGSGTGGTTTVDKPNATMGETVTVTTNPNTGYTVGTIVIIDASGNTVNVTYNNNGTYTFIMPAGDVTINVTYVLINYTIIINGNGTGGTTTVDKPNATEGETVTVTPHPNTGYTVGTIVIIDASGNTVNVTYNNNGTYTFIMPAGNVTINVTYVLINYTIIINNPTNGTVTVDKPNATMGETVTITPTPSNGYGVGTVVVIDASGNTVNVTYNNNGTYTFIMPAGNVTINVTFIVANYTVVVNTPSHGTVTVDKPRANAGDIVTITPNPELGYGVNTVVVRYNGRTVTVTRNDDGTYSFVMPSGNVTITVTFVLVNYTIIINNPSHGTVTVDKTTSNYGKTVVITPTADDGYEVNTVVVTGADGVNVTVTRNADGTYSFVMPACGVTITVTFTVVEDPVKLTAQSVAVPVNTLSRIPVKLNNKVLVSGFSMQVVVPEGIHFRGEAIAAPRCADFNITTQANADSTLITITGTMTGEPLAADNAPFIYLPIKSGREIRNYVIQLRNLQFTTVSTLFGTVNLPATSVTMHVLNIGDVNGDKVVDVADVNALTNLVLGNGEDVPYPEVGDLDGNGIYDVSDINALINLILGND